MAREMARLLPRLFQFGVLVSEFCVCVMLFTTVVLIVVLIERSAFLYSGSSAGISRKSDLAAPDFCEPCSENPWIESTLLLLVCIV